ncbi:ABC transporter substrate-binding protein [Variovorax sp. LjRoot84]|uniref:ABC transporter substrate-binding protein n=1 Tax=Variovorax sp. LjRoot84 TaxID=3342340 RepID=UPI003ECF532A
MSRTDNVVIRRRRSMLAGALGAAGLMALSAWPSAAMAQKKYDAGASDTEIRIGNTMPYSGPASAYGTIGKTMAGYFDKVNAGGGINGRKIRFISLDDAYSPPKTVEQTRQLVEQEEVLLIAGALGTPTNAAVQKYLNMKKIPQLFVDSGSSRWADPKNFPWTMGMLPTYTTEGAIYAQHILETNPNARIAVLYQNDDLGKDYLRGFMGKLGDKAAARIAAQASFEVSAPTIDSQLVSLKASGADTLVLIATPKAAAQAIRRSAEMGWKPVRYLSSTANSVDTVLQPAGLDNATGVYSATYIRVPSDPMWKDSKEVADYKAWIRKYNPAANPDESYNVTGYYIAQVLEHTLRRAGDNLTRENVLKQAANLDLTLPMLYPGVRIRTTPDDYVAIKQMQLIRFNGEGFEPIGPIRGQ